MHSTHSIGAFDTLFPLLLYTLAGTHRKFTFKTSDKKFVVQIVAVWHELQL